MIALRHTRRLWRDESGSWALEFAMTLPAFVALTFGTIQLGWAMFCGSTVQYALEHVARNVMVDSTITQSTAQTQFDDDRLHEVEILLGTDHQFQRRLALDLRHR